VEHSRYGSTEHTPSEALVLPVVHLAKQLAEHGFHESGLHIRLGLQEPKGRLDAIDGKLREVVGSIKRV
jgi:hypothetical protein